MRHVIILVLVCIVQSGCTLIPKPVEYFQDRVQPVPVRSEASGETLRQAARLAASRAAETERAALTTEAAPSVLRPARDTAVLTDSVSDRLGPPSTPCRGEIEALISRLDAQEARFQRELTTYRESIRSNVGKPIEGTGSIRLPYFGHLLLVLALVAAAWIVLRVVTAFNAPVSIGLKTIQGSSRFLGRALAEVVQGGQEFKALVQKRLADQPDLAEAVVADFLTAQRANQSRETQSVIKSVKR